jgi:hypothetical protein
MVIWEVPTDNLMLKKIDKRDHREIKLLITLKYNIVLILLKLAFRTEERPLTCSPSLGHPAGGFSGFKGHAR